MISIKDFSTSKDILNNIERAITPKIWPRLPKVWNNTSNIVKVVVWYDKTPVF